MNKEMLCNAFCANLEIHEVPAGLAVRTPFSYPNGDVIGFYLTRDPENRGAWRFEDSGMIVPQIEAGGVSFDSGPRREAFFRLLSEFSAEFDEDSREIVTSYFDETEIPEIAPRFAALLLRMQDFELMHAGVVASTFRHDVERAISERFINIAKVEFRAKLSDAFGNYLADAIITPPGNLPMAVYFATTEAKVDEAVIMHFELREKGLKNPVALVLEQLKPPNVSSRALRRAHNRLDAIPVFRDDEAASMERLADQIGARN